jgi:hypothetical protein
VSGNEICGFHDTPESKQSSFALRNRMTETLHIWRDFGKALPFQTRLTQTKTVLPLSNEQSSQVKDHNRRHCCHNKHKKFPYRPTGEVFLLSRHASYLVICVMDCISGNRKQTNFSGGRILIKFLPSVLNFKESIGIKKE